MASRPRDDESLHSGGGPARSTRRNSIRSRHEPSSASTSSTNISLRRGQQTPAQLSNQSSRRKRSDSLDHGPDPSSIKGQANVLLESTLRAAREAYEADKPTQTDTTNSGGTTKSRARRIVEENRGGVKSSPKTPAVAHGFARDDVDASVSGSMGAKAHKDKMAELQQENYDLKLRIFHLREKSDKMEEQLAQAQLDTGHALDERDQALRHRDEALALRDEASTFATKLVQDKAMQYEAIMQAAVRITDLEVELDTLHKELDALDKDNDSTVKPRGQYLDVEKSPNVPDNSSIRAIKSSPPTKTKPTRTGGEDSSTPVQQNFQSSPAHQPAGDGSMVRQPSMPKFLHDTDPQMNAMRAMFMPSHQSINSLALASENGSEYNPFGERTLNSPSMSVISEGSLPSVYPKKQRQDGEFDSDEDEEASVVAIKRGLAKPNIKKWAGDLGQPESFEDIGSVERKQAARQELKSAKRKQIAVEKSCVSISSVADAAPLSTDELQRRMINRNFGIKGGVNGIVRERRQRFSESRTSDSSPAFQAQVRNFKKKNGSRDAQSYGGLRILPPSPDTFSTNTLQVQNNPSSDTLNSAVGSTQSSTLNSTTYQVGRTPNKVHKVPSFEDNMDKRRSRMGGALFNLTPDKESGHNGHGVRRRRSIAGTITSRREGHALDTATQSEAVTETNSDMSSEATSKDPYANLRPNPRSAAFYPPIMFNMSSPPEPAGYRPAGHRPAWDILPDLKTPGKNRTSTAMGYRERESDTLIKRPYRERSYSAYSIETRRQSVGPEIGNSFHTPIKTPDRRSSLASTPISNEKRMRRLRENQEAASIHSSSPVRQPGQPSAKSKQPCVTITTEPLLDASQLSSAPQILLPPNEPKKGLFQRVNFGNFRSITNPQFLSRGQKENKALEEERATPPPITRSGKSERTERARREAAQRHLNQQWSSPNPAVRPSTADGTGESGRESRRAVTFGGEENRDNNNGINQPSQQRGGDSHQDERGEMDAQKALDSESKSGKRWGFSLGNMGNRTLRRK